MKNQSAYFSGGSLLPFLGKFMLDLSIECLLIITSIVVAFAFFPHHTNKITTGSTFYT